MVIIVIVKTSNEVEVILKMKEKYKRKNFCSHKYESQYMILVIGLPSYFRLGTCNEKYD